MNPSRRDSRKAKQRRYEMEIPKKWTVIRTSLGTKDRREIREIKGQIDERIVNRNGKVIFCHFGVSSSRAVMLRAEYQWMKNLG